VDCHNGYSVIRERLLAVRRVTLGVQQAGFSNRSDAYGGYYRQ
jgi:hypothetical protein